MSNSEEKASGGEPDAPQNDSVLDFLYHDSRRVGSFLAQFDDAGLLERLIQRESATVGSKRSFKVSAGGGVPAVGTGQVSFERGPGEEGSESSERIYDPLWANARTFLDYLESKNMIERNLAKARLGQFVLAAGSLIILDLVMLQSAWKMPSIKRLIQSGSTAMTGTSNPAAALNRHARRKQERTATPQQPPVNEIDVLIDLLSMLPHAVQARLNGPSTSVWCSLRQDAIVGASSDLVLKHGILVPGEWRMLGILDAMPDQVSDGEKAVAALPLGLAGTIVGQLAETLAPVTRQLLGRPPEAFGMTPLLVYRTVSG